MSEDTVTCRSCGGEDRWEFRKAFEALGSECVEYGVLYRDMYERDLAAGGCNSRYALPGFDQLLIFAGISAASGIIGGVAYDLVKAVILKIANSAPIDEEKQNDPFRIQFLQKEENINLFIKRIDVYLDGMRDVHPSVKGAIVEELVVHEMGRLMEKSKFDSSRLLTDKEKFKKLHKKSFRNVIERQKLRPSKKHWKQVWKQHKHLVEQAGASDGDNAPN